MKHKSRKGSTSLRTVRSIYHSVTLTSADPDAKWYVNVSSRLTTIQVCNHQPAKHTAASIAVSVLTAIECGVSVIVPTVGSFIMQHWLLVYQCIVLVCIIGLINVLLQHSCVYVRRSGQFHANQAQEQLDELVRHRTPVCHVLFFHSWKCAMCIIVPHL